MKKILVITITRNRLETTRKYLSQLKRKAGYEYKHVIVDNGSLDGTVEWLKGKGYDVVSNIENEGIVRAWVRGYNYAIKKGFKPDYVMKFDDDCEIVTDNILQRIMNFYEQVGDKYITAPLDLNILPSYKPQIVDNRKELGSFRVEITTHTGGMFTVIPIKAFELMIKDGGIEKDVERGGFWRNNGYFSVYLQDLKTLHQGIGKSADNYKF
jgi:glycosyltransferase involved in cell wall biosynthesis